MKLLIYALLLIKNSLEETNEILAGCDTSDKNLQIIAIDKIGAIVGNFEGDLIADKAKAIEFAKEIEVLSNQFTLLPVRFGSLMVSTEAILDLLNKNSKEIQNNLLHVENRYEFGLKVMCDSSALKSSLVENSGLVVNSSHAKNLENPNSVYRNWLEDKLKEHRLEELVLNYVDTVIKEITEAIEILGATAKFKKMVSEKTIIDAVFLLAKDQKNEMVDTIIQFQKKYINLMFILTGPWPPYNFVELTLK